MRLRNYLPVVLLSLAVGCMPGQQAATPDAAADSSSAPADSTGIDSSAVDAGHSDQSDASSEDSPAPSDARATTLTNRDWPFDSSPTAPAFTLKQITDRSRPILLVVHDDEGDWQFLDGSDPNEDDAQIVLLRNMLQLDRTVAEVADLPRGWRAKREAVGKPWQREQR